MKELGEKRGEGEVRKYSKIVYVENEIFRHSYRFLYFRRNANQKTVVNEAQSSLSSSIHMLKRRRSESSDSDSSDSFDEDADEYGDESMNQKISNVSGIVAPEVYQQKKKKRRRLADKGTSTTNNVGPKKVVFADEVQQQKSTETPTSATPTPSNGTRLTLPRISDIVNTSIKTKQKSHSETSLVSSPTKPLISSKEELEHDR